MVVLDQESTQQKVIKNDFKVSPGEPWLHMNNPNNKIFAVWDVPHLLKNIRNNLKKHDLKVSTRTLLN